MGRHRFRPRRGRKSTLTSKNPLLLLGELIVEVPESGAGTGKIKMKMGDGERRYNDLPYAVDTGSEIQTTLVNMCYPIGAIYMSTNSTSPESFMPGTKWERIQDRFLMAAGNSYKPGSTGGSNTKTLSTSNLPTHNHSFVPQGTVSSSAVEEYITHNHELVDHYHNLDGYTSLEGAKFDIKLRTNSPNETEGDWNTSVVQFGKGGAMYVNDKAFQITKEDHRHKISGGTAKQSYYDHNSTGRTGDVVQKIQPRIQSSFDGTQSSTSSVGSGSPIDIMPPYETVYVWKRVS